MFHKFAIDYTTTTTTTSVPGTRLAALFVPIAAIVVFMAVCQWKVFKKAGKPGWAAIVPVYNTWVLFEITGYPAWIALLAFVPFVGLIASIVAILASFKLAKLFGKSDFFAVMNVLFPFVTYPILAFGSATFKGSPETASFNNPGSFDPTSSTGSPAAPNMPDSSFTPPSATPPVSTPPAPQPPQDQTPPSVPPATPAV